MHPRIAELLEYVDRQREVLRAAAASVPSDKCAMIPPTGGWSVLGVLEHLSIVEARITGLLRQQVAKAREAGLGKETDDTPVLPGMNLDRTLDRTTKLNGSQAVQPTGTMTMDAAWKALHDSRESFRSFVIEADGLALRDVKHPHVFFGPLDVYEWIAFIGSHEARHADQIREIGASLAGT